MGSEKVYFLQNYSRCCTEDLQTHEYYSAVHRRKIHENPYLPAGENLVLLSAGKKRRWCFFKIGFPFRQLVLSRVGSRQTWLPVKPEGIKLNFGVVE